MKEPLYARKGQNIITLATGAVEMFKTANQAKKASRLLQLDLDGALGRGTLRATNLKRKFDPLSVQLPTRTILNMRSGRMVWL